MGAMPCNKCGKEVNVHDGGLAMMLGLCRNSNVNFVNVAFCADCYKKYVNSYLHMLNNNACLGIVFSDEVKE